MKNISLCSLVIAILLLPVVAPSQESDSALSRQEGRLHELLVPLDESEVSAAREANDYFIKSRLYFAKRHRFVRIDKAALETSQPITISLFADTTVTVERDSIRSVENRSIRWKGKIVDPPYPISALVESGLSEGEAASLWPSVISLLIVGVAYDRDVATNQSFPSQSSRNAQGYTRPSDQSRISQSEFYSFAFDVSAPSITGAYQIRALEATPEYHLVYEIDPSKEYSIEPSTNEENERRRKAHEAYKSTLGEDPRSLWSLRHAESQQ